MSSSRRVGVSRAMRATSQSGKRDLRAIRRLAKASRSWQMVVSRGTPSRVSVATSRNVGARAAARSSKARVAMTSSSRLRLRARKGSMRSASLVNWALSRSRSTDCRSLKITTGV